MLEVPDVKNGQNELDVRVVTDTVRQCQVASVALATLVARSEAAVEDSMFDGAAVAGGVEVSLVGFEFGDGDGFAGGEDGELDVFAVREDTQCSAGDGEERGSEVMKKVDEVSTPFCCASCFSRAFPPSLKDFLPLPLPSLSRRHPHLPFLLALLSPALPHSATPLRARLMVGRSEERCAYILLGAASATRVFIPTC
jgi:hypothetical protein